MNPALFLDRDGVLNELVLRDGAFVSPRFASEFRLVDGVTELLSAAVSKGLIPVVVTNQPDIGRGLMEPEQLAAMHRRLTAELGLEKILVAEAGEDTDPLRKPNPGMLFLAAEKWNLDLGHSWLIGDSVKDIEAGQRAGVGTILLETNYNREYHGSADENFPSIRDITQFLLTL
ncbi:MAG: HAD-IIIA family hydrolase [Terrimicrobiaceae bacterium]|nr:HAD-IIIA family hydrolase [Terrimicrobiaceae bacterium]